MSSNRVRLAACLALLATLPLACGKQGDPTPRPRAIPQPAHDLTLRVRGDKVLLEFSYPPATIAGMPLEGLASATVYEMTRNAPPQGQTLTVSTTDLDALAEPVLEVSGADLDAAVVGNKLRLTVPLPETGNPPYPPPAPAAASGATAATATASAETPTAAGEAVATRAAEPAAAGTLPAVETPAEPAAAPATPPATAPAGAPTAPGTAAGEETATPAPAGAAAAAPTATAETPKIVRKALVYAVRTTALKGEISPWSNAVSVVPVPVPPPPGNLDVEGRKGGVALSWAASDGAVGYVVLRREATDPTWGAPVGSVAADVSNFLDSSAIYGTRYVYTVLALAAATPPVESAPVVEREVDYRDVFAPVTPTGLRAVVLAASVRLIWEESPDRDVVGYIVERATPGGNFTRLNPVPVNQLEYSDTTAPRGQVLTYRVLAIDRVGNISPPSETAEAHPR